MGMKDFTIVHDFNNGTDYRTNDPSNRTISIRSEKYKYVYHMSKAKSENWYWCARLPNKPSWTKTFKTEREAALAVDKKLIERGKSPVNILKKCS